MNGILLYHKVLVHDDLLTEIVLDFHRQFRGFYDAVVPVPSNLGLGRLVECLADMDYAVLDTKLQIELQMGDQLDLAIQKKTFELPFCVIMGLWIWCHLQKRMEGQIM